MSRRLRPRTCEGASPPKQIIQFAFGDSTHGASHFPPGGKCDAVLGSCVRNVPEVPERQYPNRRDAGHGETTQGGAGTKNSSSSIVISDEDTQRDIQGSNEAYSISPLEDDACIDNTLWILENDGLPDRKTVVCLSSDEGAGAEFGGTAEDLDDSSESLSCWSTASGPSLAVEHSPAVLCKDCVKLFTKMKKVKNWKSTIDYDPTSLSCEMWVLKKRWHPGRLHNVKGRLWAHLSRIRKADLSNGDPVETKKTPAFCSRPPVFLQRNLARCKSVPVQSRRQVRRTKMHPVANRRCRRKRSTRRKPCQSKGSASLAAPLPTGSDASVRVADGGIGQELDRARRVLDFDKTEPLELSGESPGCNATQSGTGSSSSCKMYPNEFSWVGEGGFRSMLSELQRCRSTVVEELHNSMS
ncbi:uncharacterized protein LOC125725202 isoform X1 [Brienomyrus brachyistius]|uniref:uncharacterized protein LOC125725202 isoform X1 n=1 Tax=Brienomyrus brachyistius TaxID=42636 RepID=UPI0020B23B74|nr:uncharacterized protein LOC125725202 isoform X1 [Brienomyrus brachyistius]